MFVPEHFIDLSTLYVHISIEQSQPIILVGPNWMKKSLSAINVES